MSRRKRLQNQQQRDTNSADDCKQGFQGSVVLSEIRQPHGLPRGIVRKLVCQSDRQHPSEVEIDLDDTHQKLVAIEKAIASANETHNGFLRELGLKPLPSRP
jgi:hypothetical protein